MLEEYNKQKIHYQQYNNGLLKSWLMLLVRYVKVDNDEKDNEMINKVIDYLHDNYRKNISNSQIARHFNYHTNYINRIFKQHTGMSLRQYIINIRIRKAMELLSHSDISITVTSREIGYENVTYFSRLFKEKVGLTPSKYKQFL